tara:strand:- start:48 stop:347 length:300 start_codon:yes stop_codon:yes gene_type:complete
MEKDYLQLALATFNGGMWYGWKTHNDEGNKIPNSERMQYQYIKIVKDSATIPSEADVNAKIQEIKDADTAKANAKISGKAKLKSGDALTDAEVSALFGE